jgi:hypothetical protein
LWRDAGFAVGALLAGLLADLVSIEAAIYTVAALTALSGVVVMVRMYETHPGPRHRSHAGHGDARKPARCRGSGFR